MSGPRFPGAPPGAYVCEEGWLIVGDEAWTEYEWRYRCATPGRIGRPRIHATEADRRQAEYRRQRARALGVPVEAVSIRPYRARTAEERLVAHRRANREYMRRQRSGTA